MKHSEGFKNWAEKVGYDLSDPEDVMWAEEHYQDLAIDLAVKLFDKETLRQWGYEK